jgi:hypothetical protein
MVLKRMSFSDRLFPVDVTDSYHLPIQIVISLSHSMDLPPSSLFKLNMSHLELKYFYALV